MGGIIREKLICKSLDFDGVGDWAQGSNTNNEYDFIEYNLPWTMQVAFQYKGTPPTYLLSTYNGGTTPRGWDFYVVNANSFRFNFANNAVANFQMSFLPPSSLVIDDWYFLTLIYDGTGVLSTTKLFFNGTLLNTASAAVANLSIVTSNNLQISRRVSNARISTINSVRFWNTNLTNEQALQEYNNGFGRLQPVLPDNCKLDLNMSKSVWNGSQFLIKDQSNNVSDFVSNNLGENQLLTECYQI
jgi:hypothetical protein